MSETKNPADHTLSVAPTKTLSLKRPVEAGIVRQSFSHGRTKAVVVEKVKRRAVTVGEAHPPRETGRARDSCAAARAHRRAAASAGQGPRPQTSAARPLASSCAP
ncbi:translation initiation factor IF-2 associated domain-containing protein [Methylocapsa polymorpha]|uniref:Translation initiation factor IF-2 associated domain-containing protein n=1 Tax=Methylocapsa polymorpha TaxID=3080828 RepID=A0ABZ0HUZ3_9HYPH|nr:translation initiation factor IF-2 associated domain-containing protein [Methylocapsa sp. RX1]